MCTSMPRRQREHYLNAVQTAAQDPRSCARDACTFAPAQSIFLRVQNDLSDVTPPVKRGSEQRPGLHATSNTSCRLDLCGSSFSVSNRRNTPMDPSESILVLQQAVACLAAENRRSEHDYTDAWCCRNHGLKPLRGSRSLSAILALSPS